MSASGPASPGGASSDDDDGVIDYNDSIGLPDGKKPQDYWDGRCCALMSSYDAPGVHRRCSLNNLPWPEIFCARFHGELETRGRFGNLWYHNPKCRRCNRRGSKKRVKAKVSDSDSDSEDCAAATAGKRPAVHTVDDDDDEPVDKKPTVAVKPAAAKASATTRSAPALQIATTSSSRAGSTALTAATASRGSFRSNIQPVPPCMWPPVCVPPEQSTHSPGKCGIVARFRLPHCLQPDAWRRRADAHQVTIQSCLTSVNPKFVFPGSGGGGGGSGGDAASAVLATTPRLKRTGSASSLPPPISPKATPAPKLPMSPMPDPASLQEQMQLLSCSVHLEAAPLEGDTWLTGALIDYVAFHFATHFPDVHYLPTNFAVVDLPNAARTPEGLESLEVHDILGRKVVLRPASVDAALEVIRSEAVQPPPPPPTPEASPVPAVAPSTAAAVAATATASEGDGAAAATAPAGTAGGAASADTAGSGGPATDVGATESQSGGGAASVAALKRHASTGSCARTRPVVRISTNPIRVAPILPPVSTKDIIALETPRPKPPAPGPRPLTPAAAAPGSAPMGMYSHPLHPSSVMKGAGMPPGLMDHPSAMMAAHAHGMAMAYMQQQQQQQQRAGMARPPPVLGSNGNAYPMMPGLLPTYGHHQPPVPLTMSHALMQQQQQMHQMQQQMYAAAAAAAAAASSSASFAQPHLPPQQPPAHAGSAPRPRASAATTSITATPQATMPPSRPPSTPAPLLLPSSSAAAAAAGIPSTSAAATSSPLAEPCSTTPSATPSLSSSSFLPHALAAAAPPPMPAPIQRVVYDGRAETQRPLLFFWNIGNMHWNFLRVRLGLRKEIELFEPMGRPQSRHGGQDGVSLRSLPHALIVWLDACYPVEGGWQRLAKSAIKHRHQITGFDCGVACLMYAEMCGQGMSRQDIQESIDQGEITQYRKQLRTFLKSVKSS